MSDAIEGNDAPQLKDTGPELLLVHGLSVADVDILEGDESEGDEPQPGIYLTLDGLLPGGVEHTVELVMPLDMAEALALSTAVTLDEARQRTQPNVR